MRPQLDNRVVHLDTDAAAHANDHGLAFHCFEPALVVFHEIGCDEIDPFGIANERLERGPLCLELLFAR